ncbi:MAG: serine/threonine protein kinase [Chloroflexi bacterium]|nr:serine/threonine protein kinase [Chloroflexota bacterium]
MSLAIGQTLGRYRLEALIGHGSMADVYRASHTASGKPVAIKIVHPHLLDQPGFVERFKREAETMATLQHPRIVQLYEFVCRPHEAYLAMEYVEGGTMEARLDRRRMTQEEISLENAVDWMETIADAVDYAHTRGLIHRDLKPANILFRETGEPVLTDFGLAHLLDHARLSGSDAITGTPAYLSPEQARGLPGDTRSDIYSLGVILYEILTGQTPFQGNTVSLVIKHISEPPPSPRLLGCYLPPGVESVVMRALAKSPTERYQSALAFVRALRSAVRQVRPAPAPPPPPAEEHPPLEFAERGPASRPNDPSRVNEFVDTRRSAPSAGRIGFIERPRAEPARLLPGILVILAVLGLAAWGWRAARREWGRPFVDPAASAPRFGAGSQVRVTVPGETSVSVLRGCPSEFWLGVLGIAADGEVGEITERQQCNGEWWYRVSLQAVATDDWDGGGWLEGRYLQPK